jgi:hypothetical protein
MAAFGPSRKPVLVGGYEDDGVSAAGLVGLGPVGQEREQCLAADVRPSLPDDDALGATLLGAAGTRPVADVHQHRDAVALCDRLAQTSVGHGPGCYPPAVMA